MDPVVQSIVSQESVMSYTTDKMDQGNILFAENSSELNAPNIFWQKLQRFALNTMELLHLVN